MTIEPRAYPDIVRDLLTTLTGGTVREPVVAPVDGPIVLDRLADRPIRRVSHLEGVTDIGGVAVPVRFTDADFELVDTSGSGDLDAIAFKDLGRRPVPGSTVTVNYYPVQTRPAPLTDLNVGSVTRTLLETVARELAQTEYYLDRIYRSAFLETAEGTSLDRVVALIGVTRLPGGVPLVRVRFSRNVSTGGRVTIPARTVVTDAVPNRYLTVTALTLEAGEPSREVLAAGARPDTAPVDAGALDRLEVLVAGISSVVNDQPAYRASAPETDDDLRRRARGALHGAARGTLDALRFGILSVPGVKDVTIQEFPNGIPGEVRIDVAYERPDDEATRVAMAERIEELRPAGVRVISAQAGRRRIGVAVSVILAGRGVSGAELDEVNRSVEDRMAGVLAAIAPGGAVRSNAVVAAALADARVADVSVAFVDPVTAQQQQSIALDPGQVLDVVRPFIFAPATAEDTSGAEVATTAEVDATLPVVLQPGVTLGEATDAIRLALNGHLQTRTPSAPLTFDGVAAAIRDESRYALDRGAAVLTVEHAGRFTQLTDGVGSYQPGPVERLVARTVDVMETIA